MLHSNHDIDRDSSSMSETNLNQIDIERSLGESNSFIDIDVEDPKPKIDLEIIENERSSSETNSFMDIDVEDPKPEKEISEEPSSDYKNSETLSFTETLISEVTETIEIIGDEKALAEDEDNTSFDETETWTDHNEELMENDYDLETWMKVSVTCIIGLLIIFILYHYGFTEKAVLKQDEIIESENLKSTDLKLHDVQQIQDLKTDIKTNDLQAGESEKIKSKKLIEKEEKIKEEENTKVAYLLNQKEENARLEKEPVEKEAARLEEAKTVNIVDLPVYVDQYLEDIKSTGKRWIRNNMVNIMVIDDKLTLDTIVQNAISEFLGPQKHTLAKDQLEELTAQLTNFIEKIAKIGYHAKAKKQDINNKLSEIGRKHETSCFSKWSCCFMSYKEPLKLSSIIHGDKESELFAYSIFMVGTIEEAKEIEFAYQEVRHELEKEFKQDYKKFVSDHYRKRVAALVIFVIIFLSIGIYGFYTSATAKAPEYCFWIGFVGVVVGGAIGVLGWCIVLKREG